MNNRRTETKSRSKTKATDQNDHMKQKSVMNIGEMVPVTRKASEFELTGRAA